METSTPTIRIQPFKAAVILFCISLLILLFSLLGQRPYETGNPTEKFFRELFTTEFFVNNGENIATYWNMFILICAAALIFCIASIKQAQKDRNKYLWWTLGVIFSYFAIDALAGVSQRFARLLRDLPTMEGGFLYNWFYPATTIFILLILLFLIWFTLRLDAQNKILFPISIVLYIVGAYKAELFSGRYAELYGTTNAAYLWISHAEEFAEYLGIILLIYLLLTYLANHTPELEFVPGPSND